MKRILLLVSIAAGMAACNTKPAEQKVTYEDTVGFAAFQEWKAINETKEANAYAMQTTAPVRRTASTKTSSSSGSMNTVSQNDAQVSKKKGISKAAKGAAIGTVAGATGGAIINKKNRVVGGVVGGIIGGVIGYQVGRAADKNDGRVQ